MAQKASGRAARGLIRHSGRGTALDIIEDAAQELAAEFFALPDFEKPKTENEFQIWAFREARNFIMRRRSAERYETCDEYTDQFGDTQYKADTVFSQVGLFYARSKPDQLIHMEFLDAIKKIETLGERDRKLVYSVVDAGDVVGYAKDNDVSLFDAMDALAHCRVVMNRIADDLADEKKFEGPSLPSHQRPNGVVAPSQCVQPDK